MDFEGKSVQVDRGCTFKVDHLMLNSGLLKVKYVALVL